jgi:histidinol dehydrogenase
MSVIRGSAAIERWLRRLESSRLRSRDDAIRRARTIIAAVRRDGDRAVARFVKQYDAVPLAPNALLSNLSPSPGLRPPSPRFAGRGAIGAIGAIDCPSPRVRGEGARRADEGSCVGAIELAIERVAAFHQPQKLDGYELRSNGSRFRHDVLPLRRVGIYAPGGGAAYVSSLIMCAVPARLAGVKEIVVATPPRSAALYEIQFVCQRLGISAIYRAGGAAAIAALAFGTESLERVDKIVGPGNRFVAAAKQLVRDEVGIDTIAGPSEIVVFADEMAIPAIVAADLAAQAEHGTDSLAVCVTTSERLANTLRGTTLLVDSRREAAEIINRIAPEHTAIQCRNARQFAHSLANCGAVFIGGFSAVALGDYIAGPNHVLPTGGTARFASPLGVYDFYKRRNVVELSPETFLEIAGPARTLAALEGLPLHAKSVEIREC